MYRAHWQVTPVKGSGQAGGMVRGCYLGQICTVEAPLGRAGVDGGRVQTSICSRICQKTYRKKHSVFRDRVTVIANRQ